MKFPIYNSHQINYKFQSNIYSMFPSSLEHPYAPRGRRRGRNDPNSRDYICPCGKSYLSYPALFTHIKIKHNGRAPGQIIKPKSQNPSKRGRPRQKQVYDSESDTNDIAANCIDRLCDFVTEFQKPDQKLCGKLKDLYTKDVFYKVYLNYNSQEQQQRYNEREDLYDDYCDNVFCQVIAQVNKRLNEPYHIDSVIVFFMMLANFINESTSGQNIEQDRNEGDYGYGDYIENDEENVQNEEYMEENQNQKNFNEQDDQIVEEDYLQEQDQSEKKEVLNQQQLQKDQIANQEVQVNNEENNEENKEENYMEEQEEQEEVNDQALAKLKQVPIRNIVNYINNFILNYSSKDYNAYQLQDFPFFQVDNIKTFISLLFNWLTMKKYVGYKLKVNQNYK